MSNDSKGHLLILDDDVAILSALSRLLGRVGFQVTTFEHPQQALEFISREPVDVALVDLMLPGMTGIEFLKSAKQLEVPSEIIIMTGLPTIQRALEAVRAGAYDFVEKPLPDPDKIQILIERAVAHRRLEQDYEALRRQLDDKPYFDEFIGKSARMLALFAEIKNFAWSNASVLIQGETGTGKELVAMAIIRNSPRRDKAHKAVSCPALKDELFESELFGHVRGAYTGADKDKKGIVEVLDGGTLFLDEVGDISESNQAKLLRFLSSGEYSRLGEETVKRTADVRLIAATNADLRRSVEQGKFRQDLYQRLNVLTIGVPALRDRLEDVPHLAYYFLRKCSEREGRDVRRIDAEAMEILTACSWHEGNVRQLENAIYYAMTRAGDHDTVLPAHLPSDLKERSPSGIESVPNNFPYTLEVCQKTYKRAKKVAEQHFARFYFKEVLDRCGGVINRASKVAGMDPPNFRKKLKEIRFDLTQYRETRKKNRG